VLLLEPVDALVVLLGDLERAAGLGGAVVVEGAARVGGEAEERDLGEVGVRVRVRVSLTLTLTKGTLALTLALALTLTLARCWRRTTRTSQRVRTLGSRKNDGYTVR